MFFCAEKEDGSSSSSRSSSSSEDKDFTRTKVPKDRRSAKTGAPPPSSLLSEVTPGLDDVGREVTEAQDKPEEKGDDSERGIPPNLLYTIFHIT